MTGMELFTLASCLLTQEKYSTLKFPKMGSIAKTLLIDKVVTAVFRSACFWRASGA